MTAREPRRRPAPQGWLECTGISGWLPSEAPAGMDRNRRLLEPIGNIPPAEAEDRYYAMLEQQDMAA